MYTIRAIHIFSFPWVKRIRIWIVMHYVYVEKYCVFYLHSRNKAKTFGWFFKFLIQSNIVLKKFWKDPFSKWVEFKNAVVSFKCCVFYLDFRNVTKTLRWFFKFLIQSKIVLKNVGKILLANNWNLKMLLVSDILNRILELKSSIRLESKAAKHFLFQN